MLSVLMVSVTFDSLQIFALIDWKLISTISNDKVGVCNLTLNLSWSLEFDIEMNVIYICKQ